MNALTPDQTVIPPRVLADALRFLAMDAVEQAQSGHVGMPMGMADVAAMLWRRFFRHNPADPTWPDRDRFVLSSAHGSMLLYGLLHLTGYDLPVQELKRFRQLHSATPGYPELGRTHGVEATTGPPGQGLATAVGMALAEQQLAQTFNRPDHTIVNHRTIVFCGDGCLMQGVSHEACSLAGTLGLERLIVFYDDNGVSADGHVDGWFTDDTPKRFLAYGWRVIPAVDGHEPNEIAAAIARAMTPCGKPTLLCCSTTPGYGAVRLNGHLPANGTPLGAAEVAATRDALSWPYEPFEIPAAIRAAWDARKAGAAAQTEWESRFAAYAAIYPAEAAEFRRRLAGELPADFTRRAETVLTDAAAVAEPVATRAASQAVIAAFASAVPELLGGAADRTSCSLTGWPGRVPVGRATFGTYLHYGSRETGMAAALNGLALHGGFIPFGGTFLAFADQLAGSMRLTAQMRQRVIYVLTHDSIGLGEDGPTHQPVEQAGWLRLIPHLDVWRPCDSLETAVAWCNAVSRADGPTALLLSRQELPSLAGGPDRAASAARGGYILSGLAEIGVGTPRSDSTVQAGPSVRPDIVLIATGSEVQLAVSAERLLRAGGITARTVSMPSTSVFERQDATWRTYVLPPGIPRVVVEAGATGGWYKYATSEGVVIGIDEFGLSAPGPLAMEHHGFTAEKVAATAIRVLNNGFSRSSGPSQGAD